eukprot:COSAG01_NODE_3080_length_6628_cov_1.802420_8_plen_40_part_00
MAIFEYCSFGMLPLKFFDHRVFHSEQLIEFITEQLLAIQ